jgi:hypothetical protein
MKNFIMKLFFAYDDMRLECEERKMSLKENHSGIYALLQRISSVGIFIIPAALIVFFAFYYPVV